MKAFDFWKAVTGDQDEFLARFVVILTDAGIKFCVVGDYAVNAYAAEAVVGLTLPVAAIEDVLRGKIWAAQDPERRASKRQKDLADIARLLETHPQLREQARADILKRLI